MIFICISAEREGFEPPVPLSTTVFKTAAFDHSAISPGTKVDKICFLANFSTNFPDIIFQIYIYAGYWCSVSCCVTVDWLCGVVVSDLFINGYFFNQSLNWPIFEMGCFSRYVLNEVNLIHSISLTQPLINRSIAHYNLLLKLISEVHPIRS